MRYRRESRPQKVHRGGLERKELYSYLYRMFSRGYRTTPPVSSTQRNDVSKSLRNVARCNPERSRPSVTRGTGAVSGSWRRKYSGHAVATRVYWNTLCVPMDEGRPQPNKESSLLGLDATVLVGFVGVTLTTRGTTPFSSRRCSESGRVTDSGGQTGLYWCGRNIRSAPPSLPGPSGTQMFLWCDRFRVSRGNLSPPPRAREGEDSKEPKRVL